MGTEEGSGTGASQGPQVRLELVWVESIAAHDGASALEQARELIGPSAGMSPTALIGQSGEICFCC